MAAKVRGTLAAVTVLLLAASVSAYGVEVKTPTAHAAHGNHHLRTGTIHPKSAAPKTTKTSGPVPSHPDLGATSVGEIIYQTKLGAQFLKTAAQLTEMLSEEEKEKMIDDVMVETTHDIVGYTRTLLGSLGQGERAVPPSSSSALSPSDSWSEHGSHSKRRPVCTVISGPWDSECECDFIPQQKRPHRPRPDEVDEDDDEDFSDYHHGRPTATEDAHHPPPRKPKPRPTRPARPEYPEHQSQHHPRPEHYPNHPRPEHEGSQGHYWQRPTSGEDDHEDHHYKRPDSNLLAHKVETVVGSLSSVLTALSNKIGSLQQHPSASLTSLRSQQREQLITAPLEQVAKLQSLVNNRTLLRRVKSGGGLAMERFLKQKVADLGAMVNYPDYLADQLGKAGGEQPIVLELQAVIDRLEPLSF